MKPDKWEVMARGNGRWGLVNQSTGEYREPFVSAERHRLRVALRNAINCQPSDPADYAVYQAEVLDPLQVELTDATARDIRGVTR